MTKKIISVGLVILFVLAVQSCTASKQTCPGVADAPQVSTEKVG